uniref:Uncharacterized protein n=1 Tax=Arundo donax TaxID=35708 RepID=A0A0A9AU86_ARUDO
MEMRSFPQKHKYYRQTSQGSLIQQHFPVTIPWWCPLHGKCDVLYMENTLQDPGNHQL